MSRRNEPRQLRLGIVVAIATNIVAAATYYLLLTALQPIVFSGKPREAIPQISINFYNAFVLLFWSIGFSQILHIVPIALWMKQRRQFEKLKGLLIGAGITALLCGSCFALLHPVVTYYFLRR